MHIILASSSPRRKEILREKKYTFDIVVSEADETFDDNLDVYENVRQVALKKCQLVAKNHKDSLVIGCDTIVVLDNTVYLKPLDKQDAFNTLKNLSNKTHEVISGVGIIYKNLIYNFHVISKVTFKNLSDEDILNYIATKEPFGKSGSYAIQGEGRNLVSYYEGSLTNIIGLPIERVSEIIDEVKVKACHLK